MFSDTVKKTRKHPAAFRFANGTSCANKSCAESVNGEIVFGLCRVYDCFWTEHSPSSNRFGAPNAPVYVPRGHISIGTDVISNVHGSLVEKLIEKRRDNSGAARVQCFTNETNYVYTSRNNIGRFRRTTRGSPTCLCDFSGFERILSRKRIRVNKTLPFFCAPAINESRV